MNGIRFWGVLAVAGVGALIATGSSVGLRAAADDAAAPAEGPALVINPKASPQSSYDFEGRITVVNREVSFDVPPDYRDGIEVWIGKLRNVKKTELVQILTMTREEAEDGTVPFHQQIPNFQVELMKDGRPRIPYGSLERDVAKMAWEGVLDPFGNIKEIHLTTEDENPGYNYLSFPLLADVYPHLDGPKEIKVGEKFTTVAAMPLPSPINITGLDEVGFQMTREYVLREIKGTRATFDVRATFKTDPATPPTVPRAACDVSGGGVGSAVFDTKQGVFVDARISTKMTIDVVAPMKRLPHQAADYDPGVGKVKIELDLLMRGKQVVKQLFD